VEEGDGERDTLKGRKRKSRGMGEEQWRLLRGGRGEPSSSVKHSKSYYFDIKQYQIID
jgi:hypothetical protein